MRHLFALLILAFATTYTYAQPDCVNAVPACTTPSFPVLGGSGPGLVNDIPPPGSISNPTSNPAGVNSGCLLAGELNPTFITITVTSAGLLEFSMGDGVPTGCFDWAMWQVPAGGTYATGCAGIQSNTLPPVTCNWNGACGGYTGIASVPPTHPATGVTGSPYDFQPPLVVNPGDQFILCFSNYSGLSTTVPMSFFGSASVSCNEIHFICPGGSATLNGPTGGSGYSWSPSTGLSATTGASVIATPSAPTTYTCTYTTALGATATFSYDVVFYATPVPNFTITPEACAGDNDAIITMNPTGGVTPYTYTINGTPDADGIFAPMAPGMYLVQVTGSNGCVGDTIVNVVAAAPCCSMILGASMTATLCPGSCDGTATVDITTPTGPVSISWLNASGTPIGQTTPTALALCAGNYVAQVTDDLCTLTSPITVTELPGPVINSVDLVQPLCAGNANGSLTINHTGATQFSINGGTTYQPSNVFTGLTAGTYNIKVLNGNNCEAVTTVTLGEPTALVLTLDSIRHVSCNNAANGAVFTTIAGGTVPYNIAWTNSIGPIPFSTPDIVDVVTNTYTITVTDAFGCTQTQTATVNQPDPLVVNISTDSVSCFGYCDGTITANVNGGTLPYSYNWLGTSASTSNTAVGLCLGDYDLKVTDANGCVVTTADIYMPQPLQVQVGTVSVKDERCFASCDGVITINSPTGYTYSVDGGNTYLGSNVFTGLCAGIYDVFVKDIHGCFNSTTAEVERPPKVEVNFGYGPQPTDIFQTEITFTNQTSNASHFTWLMDSLAVLTTNAPVFTFPPYYSGEYNVCLIAENDSACVDTICHTVVIDDHTYLFLPNSFTPNADGKNDLFTPVINNVEEEGYEFMVFNRWGQLVFSTTDPMNKGWDGTHNGIKAPVGIYVWKIRARSSLNAEKKEWNGHVNLLE